MALLAALLVSVAAGLLQTVTGFGSATVLMAVFPYFFDMVTAPALSSAICLGLAAALSFQFRQAIRLRLILAPALIYTAASIWAIHWAPSLDSKMLTIAFGAFFVLLSVYFLLFSGKAAVKVTPLSMAVCSTISGICAGLFSIGGPTMALYYLAATDRREEYIANIQCLFVITYAVGLLARIGNGTYTRQLLPLTIFGIVGILIGKWMGLRLTKKLNGDLVKTLIYIYIGLSGIITICQQIL